jgi:methyl-accepting chemotaxis protein
MSKWSIRVRLLALVSMLLSMVVLAAAWSVVRLSQSNATLGTVYNDRVVPLQQLKLVADAYRIRVVDATRRFHDGAMRSDQAQAALMQAQAQIQQQWTAYEATYLVPKEKALVAQAHPLMSRANEAIVRMLAMLKAGDKEALGRFTETEVYPVTDQLAVVLDQLTQLQLDVAAVEYHQAQDDYGRVLAWSVGVSLMAVVLGGSLAWLLIRAIADGLSRAVEVAQTVAQGDLSSRIATDGHDEIAQLMCALKGMNDSLSAMVSQVRGGADCIATGSAQIATGNMDLSQRTELQASSLQETAASMEQLMGAVRSNAETAQRATHLVRQTTQAVTEGGGVVRDIVVTMEGITGSSRKIADIIGVIDGIAFQTNILALNAAVESARAGEQGRGFAVVASEVRSLAQRSATAAREIKVLIDDSVEKVELGARLVGRAGHAMDDIVGQVQQVNELIQHIGTASAAQSGGIAQISEAVQQLDDVTQQNAALVEQSAAAAGSLQRQSDALASAVARFRLAAVASA